MATGFMTPNYQDLDTLASEAKTALNVFSSGSFRPGSWEMIVSGCDVMRHCPRS